MAKYLGVIASVLGIGPHVPPQNLLPTSTMIAYFMVWRARWLLKCCTSSPGSSFGDGSIPSFTNIKSVYWDHWILYWETSICPRCDIPFEGSFLPLPFLLRYGNWCTIRESFYKQILCHVSFCNKDENCCSIIFSRYWCPYSTNVSSSCPVTKYWQYDKIAISKEVLLQLRGWKHLQYIHTFIY